MEHTANMHQTCPNGTFKVEQSRPGGTSVGRFSYGFLQPMTLDRLKLRLYRDRLLGAVVAICIVAAIGHYIDWREGHKPADWQISLAFVGVGSTLALCSPNRVKVLFYCFLAITAFGILGAIAGQTLAGLPIILPSALIVLAMMRWKAISLK
jgi:hypothetical protein